MPAKKTIETGIDELKKLAAEAGVDISDEL